MRGQNLKTTFNNFKKDKMRGKPEANVREGAIFYLLPGPELHRLHDSRSRDSDLFPFQSPHANFAEITSRLTDLHSRNSQFIY
tara:strand:- start:158 stop:406 length:249 start_codon:yes stop_codon:yes gene_type:complete